MKSIKLVLSLLFMLYYTGVKAQWIQIVSGSSSNLVDGCFVNDSTCFALGETGEILKSVDKGNSWSVNIDLPGIFTSICHVGQDTLYVGGNCLYRSYDRGLSWVLVTNFNFTITDLGFFAAKKGIMIVTNGSSCTWGTTINYDLYYMLETTDYGVSWHSNSITQYPFDRRSKLQFLDDSTVYNLATLSVSAGYHCMGKTANNSMKSQDRGITWQNFIQPLGQYPYFSPVNRYVGYYISGYQGGAQMWKSIDGEITYTPFNTGLIQSSIRQLEFVNELDGYVMSKNTIHTSTTGGTSWALDYSSPSDTLNQLIKSDSLCLIVLGRNGRILKKQHNSTVFNIYRLKFNTAKINFGGVQLGDSLTKQMLITNTGNVPVTVRLNASTDFSVSLNGNTFDTLINNVSLASLESKQVFVKFKSQLPTSIDDTLLIFSDSIPQTKIALKGIGYYPFPAILSNDTIVCADTLRIDKNLTIDSTATLTICAGTKVLFQGPYNINIEGNIQVLGTSSNRVKFLASNNTNGWEGISISSSPNKLSSFKNAYFYSSSNSFISLIGGNVAIDSCYFLNTDFALNNALIKLNGSPNLKKNISIRSTTIRNLKGNGIEISNGDSVFISDNQIYDCTGNGIRFSNSSSNKIEIKKNQIYNNTLQGIYGTGSVLISDNLIHDNGGGIEVIDYAVVITDNKIFNNKSQNVGGIVCSVKDSSVFIVQNLIFNNTCLSCNGAGIRIRHSINPTINASTFVFSNNICNNSANQGSGNNFYADPWISSSIDIRLTNNILYLVKDSNNNIGGMQGINNQIQYNCINQVNVSSLGSHNIAMPKFINPTDSIGKLTYIGTYNWAVAQQSSCINSGYSGILPYQSTLDFIKQPRIFMNSKIDIGAYEYQGTISINEISALDDYNIFPNPSDEELTIEFTLPSSSLFVLSNVFGQIFEKRIFLGNEKYSKISTASYPAGVYFYTITNDSVVLKNGKISVQH